MENRDMWKILLLVAVSPQVLSSMLPCPISQTCKTLKACNQDHRDGQLKNKVLFKCDQNKFCCPPRQSGPTNEVSTESWRPTTEAIKPVKKNTTLLPLPFAGTVSVKPQSEVVHNNENILRRHRNWPLLPDNCGVTLINKITNGEDAEAGEFPWMVLIGFTRTNGVVGYICGGTLISDRYVLTAAHCLYKEDAVLTQVRLGEFDMSTEEDCVGEVCSYKAIDLPVEKIIAHEGWNNSSFRNDIALLRLNASALDLKLSTISPICLPLDTSQLHLSEGYKYQAAGWGLTGWLESSLNDVLQKTEVAGISDKSCNAVVCPEPRRKELFCPLQRSQMCVQGTRKRDVCKGDSGGPLMTLSSVPTVQIGITSFKTTLVCGAENVPSIFTRVEEYVPWILDHLER